MPRTLLLALVAACGGNAAAPDAAVDAPRSCGPAPDVCIEGDGCNFCADRVVDCWCQDGQWHVSDCSFSSCNPITQTGCARGQRCAPLLVCDGTKYSVTCYAEGTLPVGEACDPMNDDCQTSFCYDGRCTSFCHEKVAPDCDAGETCTAVAGLGVDLCVAD